MRSTRFALFVAAVLVVPIATHAGQQPSSMNPTGSWSDLVEQASGLADTGKYREALTLLDRAAALCERTRDSSGLTRVELERSSAFRFLGNLAGAESSAKRAQALSATQGPALEADALRQLGLLAWDRRDFRASDSFYNSALILADKAGDHRVAAGILEGLGRNAGQQGRFGEALALLTRAITEADAARDVRAAIATRASRSTTYVALTNYGDALADAQEAYRLAKDTNDLRVKAVAVRTLAQSYARIGHDDRAIELYGEAIELARAAGFRGNLLNSTIQRMESLTNSGDYGLAAADAEQALTMLQTTDPDGLTAIVLARLALIEARSGRSGPAAEYARRASTVIERALPPRRVSAASILGEVALELNDHEEAVRRFTRALEGSRKLGDLENELAAVSGLGRAALAGGRLDEAQTLLRTAVDSVERLRRTLPETGLRAAYIADDHLEPHEALVETLFARSRAPDDWYVRRALEVAEQAHARTLADLLAEARARLTDPRVEAIRNSENHISRQLSDLQQKLLTSADSVSREKYRAALATAEHEYDDLVVRVRRENPAYADIAYPHSLSAPELAAALGAREALVEFLLGKEKGFAWVVRGGRIWGYRIPGQAVLTPQIREIRAFAAAGDDGGLRRTGATLYQQLLGPAAALLDGAERLVVVPDGPLHRLPFALLRGPATMPGWLIQHHALTLAPSATVLNELRRAARRPSSEPLLAFAAPPGSAIHERAGIFEPGTLPAEGLPHAEGEVRDIAQLVAGGTDAIRTGASGSEAALKRADLERYKILHFATHAVVDEIVPRRSAVLLKSDGPEDGLLQINEIAQLTLNADVVVLAACRTQMGRAIRGEGLLSLSRAFMHAGARGVVATLTPVRDAETRRFMRVFYAGLAGGLPPDQALRLAQLQMIRTGGRDANPDVWAAFVLTGDGSAPVLDATRVSQTLIFGAMLVVALCAIPLLRRQRWKQTV